jgi:hypothetical protein
LFTGNVLADSPSPPPGGETPPPPPPAPASAAASSAEGGETPPATPSAAPPAGSAPGVEPGAATQRLRMALPAGVRLVLTLPSGELLRDLRLPPTP